MEQQQFAHGGNEAFASGALANGTAAATVKTTVIVPYTINGIFASKAITDNIAPANGAPAGGAFAAQAVGTTALYGLDVDASGVVTAIKGRDVLTADITNGVSLVDLPPPPSRGNCRFGIVKVVNATNPFTFGTTAFNAAGVTTTYSNLSKHPSDRKLGGL